MAITPGFLQQQPLLNSARVRSAPVQQHGAQMWRSGAVHPPDASTQPIAEEKTFSPTQDR